MRNARERARLHSAAIRLTVPAIRMSDVLLVVRVQSHVDLANLVKVIPDVYMLKSGIKS